MRNHRRALCRVFCSKSELICYGVTILFGRFWINLNKGLVIVILIAGSDDFWVVVLLLVLILGSLEGGLMKVKLLIMIRIWGWEVTFDSGSRAMMLTYMVKSLPQVQSSQTHLSFFGWGDCWWGYKCFSGCESTSIIKLICIICVDNHLVSRWRCRIWRTSIRESILGGWWRSYKIIFIFLSFVFGFSGILFWLVGRDTPARSW